MMLVIALFAVGLLLSAFFSGAETGFYRVTRVRIVLDALAGDRIARGLLWLTNRPYLFVATTLVGNNIANYLTSLAAVMGAQRLYGGGRWAEYQSRRARYYDQGVEHLWLPWGRYRNPRFRWQRYRGHQGSLAQRHLR